ncbi:MAG TPA: hypothetical protein VGK74_15865 [Symbiobacteriaceae bacterium]|jgi:hypothetical protein
MSEERKMILQMVAEGKVTPEEAEKLLQAIDETEQTAQNAAAEGMRSNPDAGSGRPFGATLGDTIERAVSESLRALDETMRSLEISLDRRLNEQSRRDFQHKIEEKMRRAAERAVERAQDAQQRAERAAERATRKAAEHAGRAAERMEERLARHSAHPIPNIIKMGVSIDRETVEQREQMSIPAEPGDRLCVENRVGDVTVAFYDGTVIEVEVKKTVWGEDKQDAEARAVATKVELVRRGSAVELEITRPNVVGVGFLIAKDTRVDYEIRVPHGTHLKLHNKVGDLRVAAGSKIGSWELDTKVGDVDVTVPAGAGFRYEIACTVGSVSVASGDAADSVGTFLKGRVGDGAGFIGAMVKTGDIRIHY